MGLNWRGKEMENSEKNRKKCFACSSFRRYYTKGDYCFNRTEYGSCIRKQEMKKNTIPVRNGTATAERATPTKTKP